MGILKELMKLPLVYGYIVILAFLTTPISPFIHRSMNLLASYCSTIQNVTMDQVLPRLPDGVVKFLHAMMEAARHCMTRMDRSACNLLLRLTARVPALRMSIPEMYRAVMNNGTESLRERRPS